MFLPPKKQGDSEQETKGVMAEEHGLIFMDEKDPVISYFLEALSDDDADEYKDECMKWKNTVLAHLETIASESSSSKGAVASIGSGIQGLCTECLNEIELCTPCAELCGGKDGSSANVKGREFVGFCSVARNCVVEYMGMADK